MTAEFARVPLWILGRSDVSWPAKILYGLLTERPESDDAHASLMCVRRRNVRAWRRELGSVGVAAPIVTRGVSARRRAIVLQRRLCTYCGDPATCVDHVVPVSRGGTDEDSNLVAACGPCNSAKGDRLLSEWRRR